MPTSTPKPSTQTLMAEREFQHRMMWDELHNGQFAAALAHAEDYAHLSNELNSRFDVTALDYVEGE